MAHLGLKQRSPFKKSFSPARRHFLHFGSAIFAFAQIKNVKLKNQNDKSILRLSGL